MTQSLSVLFDLDGTLLDTAPDMVGTVNQLRRAHQLPDIPLAELRAYVSHGARALIRAAFELDATDVRLPGLISEFLSIYAREATNATRLFPGTDTVLDFLDAQHIRWGIVTNKPKRFTFDILKSLDLDQRAQCVVCGDTLSTCKPDPEPVIYACELLERDPKQCIFVGDSIVDVTASKAAGTKILVALYGYLGNDDVPMSWQADGYLDKPTDIITWLSKSLVI